MLRASNVREDWLVTLQMIADLSYAWHTIEALTPLMQQGIKKDPSLVSKLRATFLKVGPYLPKAPPIT
jgi:WASH complex subunit strumpellin